MGKEYTPKHIPREAWKRTTSVIRDYNRLKSLCDKRIGSDALREEAKRKTAAVKSAYDLADPETRELIKQRYWKQRTYRDIDYPMSVRTMQRYIYRFVASVARYLGEI